MESPMQDWGTNEPKQDPKTIGIVAYITLIGWIVALVWNKPKSESASFHIRQSLGLMLMLAAGKFVDAVPMGGMISKGLAVGTFVLWIIAFISALQGEQKPVPVVGEYFQDWFKQL